MNKPLQDLHPVELLILAVLFIVSLFINLCIPSPAGSTKPQLKEPSGSKIGTETTPSTKVPRPRSRSTKSTKTTEDQKKVVGPTDPATQSKPSASSRKRKPSGFSTNSTRSTTPKSTRTTSTTSA
jgi:hypothetical protein